MKFVLDENLSKYLAIGMDYLDRSVEVVHVLNDFPQGTSDIVILQYVGQNGYFLITKDVRIRYNQAEKDALIQNSVGAFFLVGKSMRTWEIVKQLVNSWEEIQQIADSKSKPFIYKIRRNGKPEECVL